MSKLKVFAKVTDRFITERLNSLGYAEIEKYIFQKKLDDVSTGMIIMEKTSRKTGDTLYVYATIGIINSKIEDLYVKLVDFIKDPNKLCTAMTSIGYLLPKADYRVWEIPANLNENQIQTIVDDFMNEIQSHILPLLAKSCDIKLLLPLLEENKFGLPFFNDYKIPIIYYLLGEKEKGTQYIQKVLDRSRPSPKNPGQEIPPTFSSLEDISQYYRKDKDVKFYYHYLYFTQKFAELE